MAALPAPRAMSITTGPSRSSQPRHWLWISVGLVLVLGIGLALVLAGNAARMDLVSAKTVAALRAQLETTTFAPPPQPDGHSPRQQWVSINGVPTDFYVTNFGDRDNGLGHDVEKGTLGSLNQDGSLPPLKITDLQISISGPFLPDQATTDRIWAYCTVHVPGFLGADLAVRVSANIVDPHFKGPWGSALAPGGGALVWPPRGEP